jgi:hypothetical protein
MTGLPGGEARLSAWASGFAPAGMSVRVPESAHDRVFRLNRGASFSLRVVDEQKAGVAGAWVVIDLPVPHNGEFRETTDDSGSVTFRGIPTNALGALQFSAGAEGYYTTLNLPLAPTNTDPVIPLYKALQVFGEVVDADSGQAIPYFKAIPCGGADANGYGRMFLTRSPRWVPSR